jgi:NADPH:quinone reductase-like Zn-dependent oxidoreductase
MGINPMNVDNEGDLKFLLELIEKEEIRPVIDRHIPLDEVPEALMDLSEGLVNGKVVIAVKNGYTI